MNRFENFEHSLKDFIKHDIEKLRALHDAFVHKLNETKASKEYIESVEFRQGVTIVRLKGRATYDTMKYIEEQFIARMKGREVKNILFDYKNVSDADTSSIAELVELWEQMKELHSGNVIGLVNIPPRLQGLLEITNIQGLFKVFHGEEAAIEFLSK
jgi:anti-anti-sigma regulatory factor